MSTRTVFDPFMNKNVQISDKLTDRLRGKYASGPHLPNGNPEFGWKQFQSPPIQHEAAEYIEKLESALVKMYWQCVEGDPFRKIIEDVFGIEDENEKIQSMDE